MQQRYTAITAVAVLWLAAGLSACDKGGPSGFGKNFKADAVAILMPTEGNEVSGTVSFAKVKNGVRVVARIDNLSPGLHGFHIHQYGDCTSPDGRSAGGHFNPDQQPHGGPNDDQRHAGDLGNIKADDAGRARADFVDPVLSLEDAASIIGRGIIVHADPDDLKTPPSGAAGARLACGVIGFAQK